MDCAAWFKIVFFVKEDVSLAKSVSIIRAAAAAKLADVFAATAWNAFNEARSAAI